MQLVQPLAGPYDVIVRAEARNIDALGRLVASRIQAIDLLELHPTLGSCWVWTGTATPYGRISKAQDTYTHRLGWKLLRGAIPKGKELHHRCERHACWNPDHLELVTHAQNRAYARKTHCKHGHPLAGANLYLAPGGLRKCRECNRAAQRAFQARHRAPGDR